MPILTTCPKCNRQLRIPDELQGKLVKCPTCLTTFQASAAPSTPAPPGDPWANAGVRQPEAPSPPPSPPPPPPAPPAPRDDDFYQAPRVRQPPSSRQDAANRIAPPAIALMIVSAL